MHGVTGCFREMSTEAAINQRHLKAARHTIQLRGIYERLF